MLPEGNLAGRYLVKKRWKKKPPVAHIWEGNTPAVGCGRPAGSSSKNGMKWWLRRTTRYARFAGRLAEGCFGQTLRNPLGKGVQPFPGCLLSGTGSGLPPAFTATEGAVAAPTWPSLQSLSLPPSDQTDPDTCGRSSTAPVAGYSRSEGECHRRHPLRPAPASGLRRSFG
jgi:hypothetical protein